MTRPIVGIVTAMMPDPRAPAEREILYVGRPYTEALQNAGAAPLLVPHGSDSADLVDVLDGLLLMGGKDIDPTRYGQPRHPATEEEDTGRFEAEAALWSAIPRQMPILGICYGCQFMNVAMGGDISQHIPDTGTPLDHSDGRLQDYSVEPESRLSAILGSEHVQGRSFHHQAIGKVAIGLRPVATADDGVVEALEAVDGRWLIGVQWHPERTLDRAESQALFRAFVDACAEFKRSKESCGTW